MDSFALKSIIEQYYQSELKSALRAINSPMFNKKEVINNAIQRCLGVASFVQELPSTLTFTTIEKLYNNVREELEQL